MTAAVDQRRRDLASPPLDDKALIATLTTENARLTAELAEVREELDGLTDQLAEEQDKPWPKWAAEIRATLRSYGVETDDPTDDSCDLADVFVEWVADYETECTRRAEAAEARVAELEAGLKPFAKIQTDCQPEDRFKVRLWDSFDDQPDFTEADLRRARALTDGGQP